MKKLLLLPAVLCVAAAFSAPGDEAPVEAPVGFVMVSNGLIDQDEFLKNLAQFSEPAIDGPGGEDSDAGEGGLGPTYNARSCLDCHNNPVAGAASQLVELRVGDFDGTNFVVPPGGSLFRQRATKQEAQQHVDSKWKVRTQRLTTNLFGDGYIEFIPDTAILAVRDAQPVEVRGLAVMVDVATGVGPTASLVNLPQLERLTFDMNTGIAKRLGGLRGVQTAQRLGRFGWKHQHASLADFAADALLNEMGRTSILQPTEGRGLNEGEDLGAFDPAADPEDEPTADAPFGRDVRAYTRFTRSLKAPPRNLTLARTTEAKAGQRLFGQIGCSVCHVPTWTTPPPGTVIRGAQPVPDALGNKIIHPYSDLLMHDIGTGDGIVQNGGPDSRNKVATAKLWGLSVRAHMMHDGLSLTIGDAVERHGGQASGARAKFRLLAPVDKAAVETFCLSL